MSSDSEKAVAVVAEYLSVRPLVRRRLSEQVNAGLKAQALEADRNSGHSVVEDEDTSVPAVSDTTGEAAIRSDRARRLLSELDHAEGDLLLACNRLVGHPLVSFSDLLRVVSCWAKPLGGTLQRSAKTFDRALGEVLGRKRPEPGHAADGIAGCQSCGKLKVRGIPWWSEPYPSIRQPTDIGGELARKLNLCEPCYRFALNQEPTRLPTLAELRHRYDHPRGHWPKRHTMPKTKAS